MSDKKTEWSKFLEVLKIRDLITQDHIDKEGLDFIGQRVRIRYTAQKHLLETEGILLGISEVMSFTGDVILYSMELAVGNGRLLNIEITAIVTIEIVKADKEIGALRKEILGNKKDDSHQFG